MTQSETESVFATPFTTADDARVFYSLVAVPEKSPLTFVGLLDVESFWQFIPKAEHDTVTDELEAAYLVIVEACALLLLRHVATAKGKGFATVDFCSACAQVLIEASRQSIGALPRYRELFDEEAAGPLKGFARFFKTTFYMGVLDALHTSGFISTSFSNTKDFPEPNLIIQVERFEARFSPAYVPVIHAQISGAVTRSFGKSAGI
jgi:hypothetical protein